MTKKQSLDINTILLMVVIAVLLVAVVVMAFMLWKNSGGANSWADNWWSNQAQNYEELSIEVIEDERDPTSQADEIMAELTSLPSISDADIVEKDFSDEWVEEFLQENNITALPVIVFSTNNFDVSSDPVQPNQPGKINTYLTELPNGEYYLEIGATYDPFVERSERGFKMLEDWILEEIRENSYTRGNPDAEVTWLEFSDFGCSFCQKMHAEDETPRKVFEAYPDNVNGIFMHMPFRNREVAEAVECIGGQTDSETFYQVIDEWFADTISTADQAYELVADSVDEEAFNTCIDEWTYSDRIDYHMSVGQDVFNVQGTPNNVLVNNQTWEYEVLPGAYPFNAFEELIDRLLTE